MHVGRTMQALLVTSPDLKKKNSSLLQLLAHTHHLCIMYVVPSVTVSVRAAVVALVIIGPIYHVTRNIILQIHMIVLHTFNGRDSRRYDIDSTSFC